MKRIIFFAIFLFYALIIKANGVLITADSSANYLKLNKSFIEVTVENQVAIVQSTQHFLNTMDDSVAIRFGFPLPIGASATQLRWQIDNTWYVADMIAKPQDSTGAVPSGEIDYTLQAYLGEAPLFYKFDEKLAANETLIVEITYVQLLEYKLGQVNFVYPNNYTSIQNSYLIEQNFNFQLTSERTIEEIIFDPPFTPTITNDGNNAAAELTVFEAKADFNYTLSFKLSLDELGLYSLSTYLPDSLVYDAYGRGFFMFIAEPDPGNSTELINKNFTLIIDRSGSMSGDKIVQARNAAKFIAERLNIGDKFNIIDFASGVESFRESLVEYNATNLNAALNYIDNLEATGSTNISEAFSVAIPQFQEVDPTVANIIIFFTDGEATSGIVDTDQLLDHIHSLAVQSEKNINIFSFGIGDYVNERLLTLLADQNNGVCTLLKDDELEATITEFYLLIKNPVLLNTEVTFVPNIIREVYPTDLPNLYQGQQMILVGRYDEAADLTVSFDGDRNGIPVTFSYEPELSDTAVSANQFLTKLWAKKKIDQLMVDYYSAVNDTALQNSIKQEIIDISLNYGVISEFTSFYGGTEDDDDGDGNGGGATEIKEFLEKEVVLQKIEAYPNPFNRSIEITVDASTSGPFTIRIYNAIGQLIREIQMHNSGKEKVHFTWDGKDNNGNEIDPGIYNISVLGSNQIHTISVVKL